MQDKPKIKVLYITYLGLLEPIPKSQVLPYLKGLSGDFDIHLLSFEKKGVLKKEREEFQGISDDLSNLRIHWHRLAYHKYPLILSSFLDIFLGLMFSSYLIKRYKIRLIHARSNIPIAIAYILRLFIPLKILYDRRGAMAAEHVENSGWKENGLLYRIASGFEKAAIRASDAVVVLTQRMNEYLKSNFNLKENAIVQTIPCCVDEKVFFYDSQARARLRHDFKLGKKFIFIYSGSLGTYNLLDEMLDFFKISQQAMPNAHFFIITSNADKAAGLIKERRDINAADITVKSVSLYEVPLYLSMADAGLIFRQDSPTAMAASPTKFAEYLACGLPVISMGKIGDTGKIIRLNNIGAVLDSYGAQEYRRAVDKLILLAGQGAELRQRCQTAASQIFSLNRGVELYRAVYKHILSYG